jgi:two-component system, NarL family, nitrate/nitrite response regulator NarL
MDAPEAEWSHAGAEGRRPALLVVSEIRLFSEGLAEVFGRSTALSAVAHCSTLSDAIAALPTLKPDIVLLDASIQDGFGFVRRVHQIAPNMLQVVLALTETPENVIAWAEAGVEGYIPKTAGLADVIPTLLAIRHGEQICSPTVASGLMRRVRVQPDDGGALTRAQPLPNLTAREQQIIALISAGLSNKEIARRLNIGVATTKSHVHNLLAKLKVAQRGQAALRMREQIESPAYYRHTPPTRSGRDNEV